jgi:hypothetical protein
VINTRWMDRGGKCVFGRAWSVFFLKGGNVLIFGLQSFFFRNNVFSMTTIDIIFL